MTVWLLAVLVAAALLLVALAVAARRRAAARDAQRVEALGRLAERLEASLSELRPPRPHPVEPPSPAPGVVAPLVADRLPGRAALLEAVGAEVERARAGHARLTVAIVRLARRTTSEELVDAVHGVTGRRAYAVGPSAVAFTLPGLGRADGLGVLARIESRTASTGRAVEWAPGETAVELVARLLGGPNAGQ